MAFSTERGTTDIHSKLNDVQFPNLRIPWRSGGRRSDPQAFAHYTLVMSGAVLSHWRSSSSFTTNAANPWRASDEPVFPSPT